MLLGDNPFLVPPVDLGYLVALLMTKTVRVATKRLLFSVNFTVYRNNGDKVVPKWFDVVRPLSGRLGTMPVRLGHVALLDEQRLYVDYYHVGHGYRGRRQYYFPNQARWAR